MPFSRISIGSRGIYIRRLNLVLDVIFVLLMHAVERFGVSSSSDLMRSRRV
jgi:hypothetical protein